MNLLVTLQAVSHVLKSVLESLTRSILQLVHVSLANLVLVSLLKHIDAMQTLDALLKLFVIVQVIVEHLVHFVLKLLLEVFLLAHFGDGLSLNLLHALSGKLEILDDQSKVLIDDEEMLRLVVHLGLLLL